MVEYQSLHQLHPHCFIPPVTKVFGKALQLNCGILRKKEGAFPNVPFQTNLRCPPTSSGPVPSPSPNSDPSPLSSSSTPSRHGRTSSQRRQPSHRSLAQQQSAKVNTSFQGFVIFMAVANEFSMSSLYRRLICTEADTKINPSAIGAVLRLQYSEGQDDENHDHESSQQMQRLSEAFVFPYGCVVIWGDDEDCERFQAAIMPDAFQPRKVPVVDTMQYRSATPGSTTNSIQRDIITLTATATTAATTINDDNSIENETSQEQPPGESECMKPHLERMAISCGLAQSIKLGAFESSMRSTIERTRHLPEQLAHAGEITASHRDVYRLMGSLFLDRYRYHLSGDLLVTPAFFWDNEAYYPAFKRVERYLEVSERGDILNKRVEVVQELYKLLGEEISNQNSMALEMAITIMIAFEILLTLMSLAKQSMQSVFIGFFLFFCLAFLGWCLWRLYRRRRSTIISNSSRAFID